jgi:hypothetical protein
VSQAGSCANDDFVRLKSFETVSDLGRSILSRGRVSANASRSAPIPRSIRHLKLAEQDPARFVFRIISHAAFVVEEHGWVVLRIGGLPRKAKPARFPVRAQLAHADCKRSLISSRQRFHLDEKLLSRTSGSCSQNGPSR